MRVDLVDPGSEGLALLTVLRDGGLDVRPRDLDALESSDADVVVLAGDAPGALEALRRLRDDGPRPDVPVVLVGAPPGVEPRGDGPAFGAEWALGRDSAPERLVRVVREVGARAVVLGAPRGLRERTLDLGREESQVARVRASDAGPRRVDRVSDVAPMPEPGSGEILLRAPISLELEAILRAGAERALPNAHDVDVSLPAGEDAARDLVPDEFIAVAQLASDEDEPAADSLTFVGGPPPLPEPKGARTPASPGTPAGIKKTFAGAIAARTAAVDPPRAADREATRSAVSTGSSIPPRPYAGAAGAPRAAERGGLTTGAEVKSGSGSALELLRTLLALDVARSERTVQIRAGASSVELSFVDGSFSRIGAPIAEHVLVALGQRPAENDVEAQVRLEALVLGGLVAPARRARLEERARRGVLDTLLRARTLEWQDVPASPDAPTSRPLPSPLARELGDAAARSIDLGRAAELIGGRTARLCRTRWWERRAVALGAPTALDALLGERGMGLYRLHAALEDEPGLPGRLVALLASGALEVSGIDAEVPEDFAARARARALVAEALACAEDGDYFAMLGVGHGAGAQAIAEAFAERSERLRALDLEALELASLGGDRDVALAALEEAQRILSRARWREAYAAALARM